MSGWFEYLELTKEEENFLNSRIKDRQNKGRIKSTLSNKNRRINRELVASKDAEVLFDKYKNQPQFLVGICLYWAEGSKRTGEFQFINSDPDMITFMYLWMQHFLGIDRNIIKHRLFIHRIPGYEDVQSFWSKKLDIEPDSFEKTIYKPTQHAIKKNPNYKGCLRLSVGGIYHLKIVKAWQKLLIKYYGTVFSV